jgi:hypothetical protein
MIRSDVRHHRPSPKLYVVGNGRTYIVTATSSGDATTLSKRIQSGIEVLPPGG